MLTIDIYLQILEKNKYIQIDGNSTYDMFCIASNKISIKF